MQRAEFGKEPEDARQANQPAGPTQTFIAEHTVAANDTLSSIALKYYGSAVREKWMPIYEANKALIGDDPGVLKVGQVLKIPKVESV